LPRIAAHTSSTLLGLIGGAGGKTQTRQREPLPPQATCLYHVPLART
jgi:hypothetical protein